MPLRKRQPYKTIELNIDTVGETATIYECRTCGRGWDSPDKFNEDSCVYCNDYCELCKIRVGRISKQGVLFQRDGESEKKFICISCVDAAMRKKCARCCLIIEGELVEFIDYEGDHVQLCKVCEPFMKRCDECDEHALDSDLNRHEDRLLCPICKPDQEWDVKKYLIMPKTLKNLPSGNAVGVELECLLPRKKGYYNENMENFATAYDGSINVHISGHMGVEYISCPMKMPDVKATIEKFAKWAKENECKINDSCGYHLHVNIKPGSNVPHIKVKKVWLAYMLLENFMFATQPKTRQKNRYCKRMTEYKIEEIKKFDHISDLMGYYYEELLNKSHWKEELPMDKYNSKRYYWFNLHPVFRQGTVEIRLHEGTTDPEEITRWAEIHSKIVKWATNTKKVDDVFEIQKKLPEIIGKDNHKYLMKRIGKYKNKNLLKNGGESNV